MATCPECDAEIDVSDDDLEEMEIGDPWDCDACASRLRVASLDPLEFETDDDEDDDDEDEEKSGEAGAAEDKESEDDDDALEDDDDADETENWDE